VEIIYIKRTGGVHIMGSPYYMLHRYQKKHSAFCLSIVGLCSVQAGFPHLLSSGFFMEQGKIMEAEVPTVQVGATPTGLMAVPRNSPRFLQAGCPSCRSTNSVKALKA